MRNSFFRILSLFLFSVLLSYQTSAQDHHNSEDRLVKIADSLWLINEYDKAIFTYEEYLDNNPEDYKKVRINLVKAYAYLGMFDTAEKRASELYGVDSELRGEYCRLGLIYTMQNRNEEALEVVNEMLRISDLNRIYPGSPTCAMFFQTKAGDFENASKYIYKIIEEAPGDSKLFFMLYASYLEAQLGNQEKAKAILSEVSSAVKQLQDSGEMQVFLNQPGGSRYYVQLAELKILQDKEDKAIEYLRKAYENGDRYYYWIKNVSPFFESIEDDPEFKTIMEEMKADIDKMRDNVESKLASR